MRRVHLVEIEDQPWCPAPIRDAATDFLRFALHVGNNYAPVAPRLRRALEASGAERIVDLCSGGGGPWPRMIEELERLGADVEVCLTDRYPNLEALERVRALSGGRLRYRSEPVDATRTPEELTGFRTLFTSFHHFRPRDALAILQDAVRSGEGIAIFETTQRSAASVVPTLFAPLFVLLATPFIRPLRLSRLFWTYLVPAVPLLALFDGTVSCLRTYSPAELREMLGQLEAADYDWEVGEEKGRGPVPITYLIGIPRRSHSAGA